MRLSARDLSRLGPDFRITRGMQDCEYHDALGFHALEDGVRKPGDDCTTHLTVDAREDVGITLYAVE